METINSEQRKVLGTEENNHEMAIKYKLLNKNLFNLSWMLKQAGKQQVAFMCFASNF